MMEVGRNWFNVKRMKNIYHILSSAIIGNWRKL